MPQRVKATKDEIPNTDELRQRNNSIISRQSKNEVETIIRTKPKIGRNDKVTIKNIQNGDIKKLKFKHAEKLIADGSWQITQN
jgi:preprotein translocase subunit SecA